MECWKPYLTQSPGPENGVNRIRNLDFANFKFPERRKDAEKSSGVGDRLWNRAPDPVCPAQLRIALTGFASELDARWEGWKPYLTQRRKGAKKDFGVGRRFVESRARSSNNRVAVGKKVLGKHAL